jgi:hypothetical protein
MPHDRELAERLRAAAEREIEGGNLAAWVGDKTPEWYAVFAWSSPDPRDPWFCQLYRDDQRTVLCLVAEMLDDMSEIRIT